MTRPLTPDMIEQINTREINPCLLVEAEFEGGTVNLWTGVGEIEWDGKTWTGGGSLLGISPVEESMRLGAKSLQFSLQGLDPAIISVALQDQYQWRPIRMWLGLLKWNLLDAPNDFADDVWEKTRSSVTPEATFAPDGSKTAWKLKSDTTPDSSHYIQQAYTPKGDTWYVWEVFAKADELKIIRLEFSAQATQLINGQSVRFDLGIGSILPFGGTDLTRAWVSPLGGGWFRVGSLVKSIPSPTSNFSPRLVLNNDLGGNLFDGNGIDGVFIANPILREQKQVLTFTPYQLFGGRMDVMGVGTDGTSANVSVTAENSLINIRQNIPRFYTEADQKARYGGDRGLEFIARIEDANIAWGKA